MIRLKPGPKRVERSYPPLYEKFLPVAITIVLVIIVILILVITAVMAGIL